MDLPAPIDLDLRALGSPGAPPLLLLHGGPGAPRSLDPLPADLARDFHVHEPSQRGADDGPLSVAAHIADHLHLAAGITRAHGRPPALVGHSWGAMLAPACAAAAPAAFPSVALIGCGTGDPALHRGAGGEVDPRLPPRPLPCLLAGVAAATPHLSARNAESPRGPRPRGLIDAALAARITAARRTRSPAPASRRPSSPRAPCPTN